MIRRIPLLAAGMLAIGLPLGLTAATASAATPRSAAGAIAQGTVGAQTGARPGFTFAGGTVYVSWTGTNSAHNVNVATANGGSLGHTVTLSDTALSRTGPAVGTALLGGGIPQVIAAWAGTDPAHHIWIGHYKGTGTLGCHTGLPETTTTSPFLVNSGWDGHGALYLLWRGTDSAHHVNIAQVNTGSCSRSGGAITLSHVVRLTDTASAGPAAAYLPGHGLYVYWPGTDPAHHIWAGLYTGTQNLANHTRTAEGSADDLGAVYDPGVLGFHTIWLTYRGTDTRVYFAYTSNTNGTDIVVNQRDGGNITPYGVGDGTDGNVVFDGFAGYDSQHTLNMGTISD